MRILISLFVLVFASGLPVWGQAVDDSGRCATASNLEERLHACSAAIESSQLSNADLATTFYSRGYAYQSSGTTTLRLRTTIKPSVSTLPFPLGSMLGPSLITKKATTARRFETMTKPFG